MLPATEPTRCRTKGRSRRAPGRPSSRERRSDDALGALVVGGRGIRAHRARILPCVRPKWSGGDSVGAGPGRLLRARRPRRHDGDADLPLCAGFLRGWPRRQAGLDERPSQRRRALIPAARRRPRVPEPLSRRHVGNRAPDGVGVQILAKRGVAVRRLARCKSLRSADRARLPDARSLRTVFRRTLARRSRRR